MGFGFRVILVPPRVWLPRHGHALGVVRLLPLGVKPDLKSSILQRPRPLPR